MKKLFLFFMAIFLLSLYSPLFSSNFKYYSLKNTSWEGYGKLDSSYKYGKHRFDFDSSDKVVHSINRDIESLYKWRVSYDGTFQMAEESRYLWKDVEIEMINSYTIKLDGLELRKAYN